MKLSTTSITEEKRIIIGLIVSTRFNQEINSVLKLDYFTNDYLRTIALWCVSFFAEFEKAPNKHIKDIYLTEKSKLHTEEATLIKNILQELSSQFDAENLNIDYYLQTSLDYFQKRDLEILVNNISILNDDDKYEQASDLIQDYIRINDKIKTGMIIDLGDLNQIQAIYKKRDSEEQHFFQFPGVVGEYLGNMKRGDVVGYYAPAKRGKTNWLIEHFAQSIMHKRKTVFWSIEMTDTEITTRTLKALYPMMHYKSEEDKIPQKFPCFDCSLNQVGDCKYRASKVSVYENGIVSYNKQHVTCTKCRTSTLHKDRYKPTVYYDYITRPADEIFEVKKMHKVFEQNLKKYSKLIVHPKYTLTYDKMKQDLANLSRLYNFVPDIIIIDYIDILDINSRHDDYRVVDEQWKLLARLAGETNTLVVTATQANKAGHIAKKLNATHQGGFYGKNQHVNLMVGLNQTPEQKDQGIMELGITEARSQPFSENITCQVLQDIKTGQAYLDAQLVYTEKKENKNT